MKNLLSILKKILNIITVVVVITVLIVLFLKFQNNKKKEILNKALRNFRENDNTMILLILGQSNAANYTEKRYTTDKNIATFFGNELKQAKDPLPGASGSKGSIWIPFSERIIEESAIERVLIICIAEGSSTVFDWSAKGKYNHKLVNTLQQLQAHKIMPTHILWQQGEQDNALQTKRENYKSSFNQILQTLRRYAIDAPVFLSLTSYNPIAKNRINNEIREAQKQLAQKNNNNVYLGPDTDIYIGKEFRYDGIHFSNKAVLNIAEDWKETLLNYTQKNQKNSILK
ncbi:MAG TPA: hypothetical protein ENK46_08785 [Flavobacteriia bacterium]|nr:hypothetical protein [Flavobacteriia bacterium]